MSEGPASLGRIARFWAPLAATWLMMSVEGPFLAAVIARLASPRENLAAYGVAFAVAILVEAPVIMMLSASTALVEGPESFRKVRTFTYVLNGLMTGFMALMLATPLWLAVAERLIGLPPGVAALTQQALALLLPWPAAIGYRRFHQGLLIRHGMPRRVAYGTVIRLAGMGSGALLLARLTDWPGAAVGAGALSIGVLLEAAASRLMATGIVQRLRAASDPGSDEPPVTYRGIVRFYIPLAMTSTISMAAHPVVTFFMGRAPAALPSLAVLPVVNSLVFIFRSMGLAYQEVAIALLAEHERNRAAVVRFAGLLGAGATLALVLLAFTPLADLWFRDVSGLSADLAAFAGRPLRILALMPALSVLLSLQRSLLVHARRTDPITGATAIELGGIVAVLALTTTAAGWTGAVAAAAAFMVGRLGGNIYLLPPLRRAGAIPTRWWRGAWW